MKVNRFRMYVSVAALAATVSLSTVRASDFVGSTSEYAAWGGIAAATLLLEWKPVNSSNPLIGGEQKPYIGRERVPDWGLGVAHLSALGTTRLLGSEDQRIRYSHGYVTAAGLNAFGTAFTKAIVGRKRPNHDDAEAQGKPTRSRSFYSGHASNTFMMATYLTRYTRRVSHSEPVKLAVPALLYSGATYTAWSRVKEHRHYTSDVIAGAVAGSLIGAAVFAWYESMDRQAALPVTIIPAPGGATLLVSF
jgi:membrane-associated phospholipid phosphatase